MITVHTDHKINYMKTYLYCIYISLNYAMRKILFGVNITCYGLKKIIHLNYSALNNMIVPP